MFDIGWSELLLIAIVALIVVGPKDLPGMFRTVGQFMGRARGMAREFQRSMEQAADESGLREAADSLKGVDRLNVRTPSGSMRKFAEKAVGGDPFADAEAGPAAGKAGAEPAAAKAGADKGTPLPAEQPDRAKAETETAGSGGGTPTAS